MYYCIIILLYYWFIIIKTSSTGQSGKNKVVYKLLSQPHKHLRHGKLKKTQIRKTTLNPSSVPVSTQVIPRSNLGRQGTPYKLGSSRPGYIRVQWMCCDRSSFISNPRISRWKLAEQTVIRVRINLVQYTKPMQPDVDDTTTRKSYQGEARPLNTPDAQEAEDDIQQLTPTPQNNTQGLGKQMQNNNAVTRRCPEMYVS